jgi:bifunctional non-homologous end joining protein LigD
MQEASISLYQKHGSTDKEYHAQLKPEGDGWVITMQNGRRGGTLTPRRKFETPVSYEVARKEYDKLVRSKISDGYSEGEAGVAFQDTPFEARFTGNVVQLYNEANPEQVDGYFTDPNWILQQKWDGHRRMVQRTGSDIIGSNRKGLQVALPQPVVASFDCIADEGDILLDGEIMGGAVVVLFDVLIVGGKNIRNEPLKSRLVHLERIKSKLEAVGAEALMVTYTARTEAEKRTHYAALKANGLEGGMWKHLEGEYKPGRPSSGGNQMKDPFIHRGSFIAGKMNKTRRSVKIYGLKDGKEVLMGNCTIPTNRDLPKEGDIIDLDYKHVFVGGAVYSPRYVGVRDDIDSEDCDVSRLHYKEVPVGEEADDEESEAEAAVA